MILGFFSRMKGMNHRQLFLNRELILIIGKVIVLLGNILFKQKKY